jgi:hypothetical protein
MQQELKSNKVGSALKWSTITEIASKLISPITNMVLARLLAPEAFGLVATVTMVVTFAEVFTDAGFQKYIGVGLCICKDKSKLDIEKVKKELWKGLKQDYYLSSRECHTRMFRGKLSQRSTWWMSLAMS